MTIKVGMISLGCSKNQVDAERLLANPHVNCIGQSAGFTGQAAVRLSEKSLNNIRAFLENN